MDCRFSGTSKGLKVLPIVYLYTIYYIYIRVAGGTVMCRRMGKSQNGVIIKMLIEGLSHHDGRSCRSKHSRDEVFGKQRVAL